MNRATWWIVGRDNIVTHAGKHLQLPQSPLRPHYVKARVINSPGCGGRAARAARRRGRATRL